MKGSPHFRPQTDGKNKENQPFDPAEDHDQMPVDSATSEDANGSAPSEAGATKDAAADAQDALEIEAQEEIQSLRNQLIRLQADFQNFRSHARKNEAEGVGLGVEKLAEAIYPILDEFEIALRHIEDPSSREGVKMIRDHLEEALRKNGIECFDPCGDPFDPNRHFAVLVEKQEGIETGIVLETLKKGFARGEKILQPAMVKVSQ